MNWNRGLHYIFLVASVGWIVFSAVVQPLMSHSTEIERVYGEHLACMMDNSLSDPGFEARQSECDQIRDAKLELFKTNGYWRQIFDGRFRYRFIRSLIPLSLIYAIVAPCLWFIHRGFVAQKETR